ncbi:MAG: cell division protein [Gammaproteobacteria bacterium]|nr:MAG: cell division protein [Gammaproteobacteria bacterium]
MLFALGQLVRSWGGSLLTAAVIGVALALPAGLYLLLLNVEQVSRGWDGAAQISVFLRPEASDARATSLALALRQRAEFASVRLISRAEALAEFRALSGLGEALNALGQENPLPAVVVLRLRPQAAGAHSIQSLVAELAAHPEVSSAQFDLKWLQRLHALTEIVKRGVVVLALILALGVILIVGNTIRLGIENRRDEIEVASLFGATNAFVRRPFLYTGFFYGVGGAILAWGMVAAAFGVLGQPVAELAALYHSDVRLLPLGARGALVLVGLGAALGLGGSWLAVGRHLQNIHP